MVKVDIDKFVNIAVLTTCVVVTMTALTILLNRGLFRSQGSPDDYQAGEELVAPSGVDFSSRPKTLLMYLSSHCRYCTESMPFYARLSRASSRAGYQMVALTTEPTNELAQYLATHEVEVDLIASVSASPLRLRGTPTLILVDQKGRVIREWRGALRERESDLERALAMP